LNRLRRRGGGRRQIRRYLGLHGVEKGKVRRSEEKEGKNKQMVASGKAF
jgi:hypothetical protein